MSEVPTLASSSDGKKAPETNSAPKKLKSEPKPWHHPLYGPVIPSTEEAACEWYLERISWSPPFAMRGGQYARHKITQTLRDGTEKFFYATDNELELGLTEWLEKFTIKTLPVELPRQRVPSWFRLVEGGTRE